MNIGKITDHYAPYDTTRRITENNPKTIPTVKELADKVLKEEYKEVYDAIMKSSNERSSITIIPFEISKLLKEELERKGYEVSPMGGLGLKATKIKWSF